MALRAERTKGVKKMEIWKVVCWSCKSNYNVYVKAKNEEQAKRIATDCIDTYNKTSKNLDFVYYRNQPELVLVLPNGTELNKLIPFERYRSSETFEEWLNT